VETAKLLYLFVWNNSGRNRSPSSGIAPMDVPASPKRWKVSAPELIAETFSSRIWKVRLSL
jgi:hypothetical protein